MASEPVTQGQMARDTADKVLRAHAWSGVITMTSGRVGTTELIELAHALTAVTAERDRLLAALDGCRRTLVARPPDFTEECLEIIDAALAAGQEADRG